MLTLQLTSYIKDAANATACTLCVCREAFDEWSPVPLGTITFVVALLWSMDILVKKWVRMVRASEGLHRNFGPQHKKELPPTHCSNRRQTEVRKLLQDEGLPGTTSFTLLKSINVNFFFFSCFFGLKSTYFKIFRFGHFQTTEKDHSNGKCCFCNESQSREVEPDQPVIQWTLVVSVVVKLALYYYFYDFLSKVH